MRRSVLAPRASKDVKWICGDAADTVVGRSHDEFCAGGYMTKLPEYPLISKLGIIEQNILCSNPAGSSVSS